MSGGVVTKPSAKSRAIRHIALPAGAYRLHATAAVVLGRHYEPVVDRRALRVLAGQRVEVTVRMRTARLAGDLAATAVDKAYTQLTWRTEHHAAVELRRTLGDRSVRTRKAGTRVALDRTNLRSHRVVDAGLAPGTDYTYTLFTASAPSAHGGSSRPSRRWVAAPGLTIHTSTDSGTSYVLKPGTTILKTPVSVKASPNADVSSARPPSSPGAIAEDVGQAVQVMPPPGAPGPALGTAYIIPVSPGAPVGYLGKVFAINPDGTITLVPGSLAETFDQLSVAYDLSTLGAIPTANRARAHRGMSVPLTDMPSSAAPEAQLGLTCDGSQTLSHPMLSPVLIPSGDFTSHITSVWHVPVRIDLHVAAYLTAGVDISSSDGGWSCGVALSGQIPVPVPIPIPMAIAADISGTVGASGPLTTRVAAKIGGEASGSLGDHGFVAGGTATATPILQVKEFTARNATVKLGGGMTFGPGVGTDGLDAIAGLRGEVTPVDLSVAPKASGCTSLTGASSATLSLQAAVAAGPLSASATVSLPALTYHWPGSPYTVGNCTGQGEVVVANPGAKAGMVGTAISPFTLYASGGTNPYSWTASGLPPGISISSSGIVSGTPTQEGTYSTSVTASASAGGSGTAIFTFIVDSSGGLEPSVLTATTLPLPADAMAGSRPEIARIACADDGSCLAVGTYPTDGQPRRLAFWQYAGGAWSVQAAPVPPGADIRGADVLDATCASATVCGVDAKVALNDPSESEQTALWVLADGAWSTTLAAMPNHTEDRRRIACTNAGACVAFVDGLLLAFENGSWSADPDPYPPGVSQPGGIATSAAACDSSGACHILGTYISGDVRQPALWTFDGSEWQEQDLELPSQADITGLNYTSYLACGRDDGCAAESQFATPGGQGNDGFSFWSVPDSPAVPWTDSSPGFTGNFYPELACGATTCVAVIDRYDGDTGQSTEYLATLSEGIWSSTPAPAPAGADVQFGKSSVSCDQDDDCVVSSVFSDASNALHVYAFVKKPESAWELDDLVPGQGASVSDIGGWSSISCGLLGACLVSFRHNTAASTASWIVRPNGWAPVGYETAPGVNSPTLDYGLSGCGGTTCLVAGHTGRQTLTWLLSSR